MSASDLPAVRHVNGSAVVRYLHAENWMIIAELRRPDADTCEQQPLAAATALPCPRHQQQVVMLGYAGPGRPTPEDAAASLENKLKIGNTARVGQGRASVPAVDADGVVAGTYEVAQHTDRW